MWPDACKDLLGRLEISKSLSILVVYCLDLNQDSCSVFKATQEFLFGVRHYFHPSNEGPWTNYLGDFLVHLPRMFLKRIGDVNRKILRVANPSSSITKAILPLSMVAFYSKSPKMKKSASASFRYMARLFPELVLGGLLEEIAANLDPSSVSMSHRMQSSIEALADIAPILLNRAIFPKGAAILESFLWQTLPGVDPNDLMKSAATLTFYTMVFLHIPLISARSESENKVEEREGEEEARRVTLMFQEWASSLTDTLINFVLQLDRFEKKNFLDSMTRRTLALFTHVFFSSLSREIHEMVMQKILKVCQSSVDHRARKYFGVLCSSLAIAFPEATVPKFLELIQCSGPNTPDSTMEWYLYLFSQAIRNSGVVLAQYVDPVIDILNYGFERDDKSVRSVCRKVTRNFLASLTSVYPMEYKIFPARFWTDSWKHWNDWGRFSELVLNADDFELSWHQPSEMELIAASKLVANEIGKSDIKTSADNETLIRSILRVAAVIEGCAPVLGSFDASQESKEENEVPLIGPKYSHQEYFTMSFGGVSLRQWVLQSLGIIAERVFTKDSLKLVDAIPVELPLVFCKLAGLCLSGVGTDVHSKGAKFFLARMILGNFREYLGRFKHPFRPLLAERARNFQAVRSQVLRTLSPNDNVSQLHLQLLNLSVQDDPTIRDSVKSVVIKYSSVFPALASQTVKFIAETLSSGQSSINGVTGVLNLLKSHELYGLIFLDWEHASCIVDSLCKCSVQDDTVQSTLNAVFLSLLQKISPIPVSTKNRQAYDDLIDRLSSTMQSSENGSLHWKYGVMASTFAFFIQSKSSKVSPSYLAAVSAGIQSQLSHSRRLAYIAFCQLVNLNATWLNKSTHRLDTNGVRSVTDMFSSLDGLAMPEFPLNMDRNFVGWNPEATIFASGERVAFVQGFADVLSKLDLKSFFELCCARPRCCGRDWKHQEGR
eukprot:TRINITY_DN3462_c0_g1_i2.p1 TRINITY_DN3462_c0_g1~~TRINITY_DN3462_c0_g1_i2.p1  ORF type:complete len:945 (+),score=209.81 TRINITY_DN3462_c0_g1_i2:184-3018(+)